MNISKIFSRKKTRQELIESLKFADSLYEIYLSFRMKYSKTNNLSIKFFLTVVIWLADWEFEQVREYKTLLFDYPYWKSRQYYCERIQKFLSNELSILDFIDEVLYPSLSNKREASDLIDDLQRQAKLPLDRKSLGFSKIFIDLIPVLEGFDEDPEESIFTEKEFREIIEKTAIKLEKYSIE